MLNKEQTRQFVSVFVGFSLVLALFFIATHQVESLEDQLTRESHYRLELLAKKVNANLNLVDGLVRFAATLLDAQITSELGIGNLEPLDRYLRREFLLHDEISYLRIFERDGRLTWASPFSPEDSIGTERLFEVHSYQGLDFDISETPLLVQGEDMIQVSRSVRDSQGDLWYIVEAGVSGATLFPLFEDPRDSKIAQLSLRTLELVPFLTWSYFSPSESVDYRVDEPLSEPYWYAVHPLESFPYFLSMVIDVGNYITSFQNRTSSRTALLFLLSLAVLFVCILNRQYSHARILTAEKIDLERTSNERKLIIQEIHHRVKNNLSLIHSVINLMIAEGGPFTEEDLNDLSARIIAIQKVHETLYHSEEFTAVEVGAYLEEVAKMIVTSSCAFPVRIVNKVRPFSLPPVKIIPLGILSAELVTNAVKYGLQPDGKLSLEGSIDERNHVTIVIRNNGKPFREGTTGLGTQLIKALADQLGGTVSIKKGKTTSAVVQFPSE